MDRFVAATRRAFATCRRQAGFCANGIRFGFLFTRARSFKMPSEIRAAGKRIALSLPQDHGAGSDFFACFVRNDYGLRDGLGEVRTIIDIGANVGFFSIAARGRYPNATIHAYEPNPRALPYLRSNTGELGIEAFPEAVGSEEGFVSIVDEGETNQARTSTSSDGRIPQVTLDTAIQRIGGNVDLLKLDCEGAEWDLFRLNDCWKQIRNVRMEYHLFHGETIQQVEQTLQRLGFAIKSLKPDQGFGMVWASRIAPPQ
jgi:FkbM family methyltransferase